MGRGGHRYQTLAARGHPFYARARFFSRAEVTALLAESGFTIVRRRSALHRPPDAEPHGGPAHEGDHATAGFLALRAEPA